MYLISVHKNRPDFRVFIDLVYGAGRNVDTDGDSNPVNSRIWTYLFIADRERKDSYIQITARKDAANHFEVKSNIPELETLAALYLFLYCGTAIRVDNRELDADEIDGLKRQYATQLRRAELAIWHKSSDEKPYPNLV